MIFKKHLCLAAMVIFMVGCSSTNTIKGSNPSVSSTAEQQTTSSAGEQNTASSTAEAQAATVTAQPKVSSIADEPKATASGSAGENVLTSTAGTNADKPSEPEKAPNTNQSKVIVIDPGHANRSNLEKEAIAPNSSELKIKDGGGAQGIATGTPEYAVNMKVALRLRDLLQKKGFTVVMTKSDNSVSIGNIDRAQVGNNAKANLVIRIHCDSSTDNSINGASMLIPSNSGLTAPIFAESKRCGQIVLNDLLKDVGMANRGLVQRTDLTGFNWSKVPVVLIEMGFLSNKAEDKLLSTDAYQEKLANSLSRGIEEAMQ